MPGQHGGEVVEGQVEGEGAVARPRAVRRRPRAPHHQRRHGFWSLVAGEHVGRAAIVAEELLQLLHGGPDPLVEEVEEV